MTKLEEVARAIYERRSRRTGYVWPGDVYPAVRNRCLSDARAAIEALRPSVAELQKPGLEAAMLESMVNAILAKKE